MDEFGHDGSSARNLFGIDVDPPFGNYFFLSTSFQDFWGRRWNLMVSSILRSFVHEPVRHIIRRSWGLYVAIIVTFFVSGLMHELLIFYVFRKQPCWDVLVFFILNGICLAVEMKVKKSLNGKWQLNQLFSILLTNGFLVCSSFWLLFPFLEKFKFRVLVMEEMANFTKLLHNVLVDPIVRSYLNASHMHETETNVSYGVI
ncbi:long-chain-alcohol O-fatty-acyltransferase-like isoform X2 [Papaver somniferum]|uniref:long-chain-alcohol O-fatty-acyltransferase-like isoform X2 n=1 Tax=Papaver somniferum TaxID=3469 RepID=UPI000E705CB5|nr:long-chain-alcohol O-fatty-acyltransferase-like isoform X2 [Papaver somniferum]